MKFALVNGQREEALPNLLGKCPACGDPMVPKCGEVRTRHWAHRGRRLCDLWWENETEWHRDWKGQFPVDWQEVVHPGENGEKHIADVRTAHGWVIEFQHSYIKPEERRSRDIFYRKLVWVVDATRLKGDPKQFTKALETSTSVGGSPLVRRVHPDDCRLLREWSGSHAPIFFDFGNGPTLWWLLARRPDEPMYVAPFPRSDFIAIHHGKGPEGARDYDEFARTVNELVERYNAQLRSLALQRSPLQPTGFQQYFARRNARRRRFLDFGCGLGALRLLLLPNVWFWQYREVRGSPLIQDTTGSMGGRLRARKSSLGGWSRSVASAVLIAVVHRSPVVRVEERGDE